MHESSTSRPTVSLIEWITSSITFACPLGKRNDGASLLVLSLSVTNQVSTCSEGRGNKGTLPCCMPKMPIFVAFDDMCTLSDLKTTSKKRDLNISVYFCFRETLASQLLTYSLNNMGDDRFRDLFNCFQSKEIAKPCSCNAACFCWCWTNQFLRSQCHYAGAPWCNSLVWIQQQA